VVATRSSPLAQVRLCTIILNPSDVTHARLPDNVVTFCDGVLAHRFVIDDVTGNPSGSCRDGLEVPEPKDGTNWIAFDQAFQFRYLTVIGRA